MKTIQSRALVAAVASLLGAAAHAQSSGNASWNAYRSIVNPSVVDDSYNSRSSEVDTRIEESFNRRSEVDTRIATDNSRSAEDSFNRTTDNSRSAEDSFNRTTNTETTVDRSVDDSYNTDASRHASGSYNTAYDYQTVAPNVSKYQSLATTDTQTANNSAHMSGASQYGSQGALVLNMGGGGMPASAEGGKFLSPASVSQGYDVAQRNSVAVDGDNNGVIRAQNALNLGGSQIVDSRIGHDQSFFAGDQTQVQGNTQDKRSATQTLASDVVSTTVGK